jgi:hypothetical protein
MTVTTFVYTGAAQSYTIPAGVTSVTLECWGGGAPSFGGGYAKGVLIVSPGTVLSVYVGADYGLAGFGGGGSGAGGGYAGAGASDVRLGGTALTNRVIVAGGAGGDAIAGGGSYYGGYGGGGGGGTGGGTGGGLGGTQTSGYVLGQGGAGSGGGGGGGGYYGGFGGGSNGGGGGGSGYTGTLINPTMTNSARTGNGQVVITAVNTAPLAPTLNTPATNAYVFAGDANTFGWTPNDADPGDYQTRADFRWRVGAAAWTTVLSAATTVAQYVAPAATFTAGTLVEWQVSTYDNAGLQSPWSASSFVNVIAALTAPTITAPAPGASLASTPASLTWTVPTVPSSDAYQVARTSATGYTGTIYYDSGTVLASSATSATVPLDAVSGRTDYLNVRFRYGGKWSPWASVNIVSNYGPPQTPLLVCTPNAAKASVSVTITNPAASGGFAATTSNDITRTSPDGSTVPIAKGLPLGATYMDRLPGAGVNDYKVTAYAASGSTATSA